MQNSPRNPVESYLQNMAIEDAIQAKIEETLSPIAKENELLKRQVEELQNELKENETKFSTVRQQLQMLYFLLDLEKLKEDKKVEQLGAFFSPLLNRNPQRARKQFSAYKELLGSNNKQEAKNIKRDLLKIKSHFSNFGLHDKADLIESYLQKINKKHGFESL